MVQNPIEKDGFKSLEDVNNRTKGALLFAPTIATREGEQAEAELNRAGWLERRRRFHGSTSNRGVRRRDRDHVRGLRHGRVAVTSGDQPGRQQQHGA
jgi:hypothetical protein